MSDSSKLSDEKMNEAYLIIAGIVTKYGEKYLPIFKRVHEEKLNRKANEDLKAIALLAVSEKRH